MNFQFNNNINNSVSQLTEAANKKLLLAVHKISTGLQINSATDDAANLALSEKLKSQERGFNASINNSRMEQALTKVAESDLSAISQNTQRMRDLTIQASNGVYGESERAMIQQEISQLNEENTRIAKASSFSDKKLLDGSAVNIQLMADQKESVTVKEGFKDASPLALGIDDVDVSTPENAMALLDKIDNAQVQINTRRAELGTVTKKLDNDIERKQISAENIMASNSTIRDTNIAQEMVNVVNSKIMMSAAVTMQTQANATQSTVMGLLRT